MPPSDLPPAVQGDGRPLVLAVDDDDTILTLVRSVLSGYRVVDFDRPERALTALRSGLRPDLILSDVQMPGMSGFELHVELRRLPALLSVPFVYLTALDRRDDVRRGMGLGADDYLTKPFRPEELREAVGVRLGRREQLQGAEPAPLGLVFTTMGGLSLSHGEQRLTWEAKRVVLLLAFLLEVGGSAPVSTVRSELLDPGAADNHIHVLTSRLRKTLGEWGTVAVVEEQVRLTLATQLAWDAATFQRLGARALEGEDPEAIDTALSLYTGASLSDFDGPWADSHRAGLEDLHLDLLQAAVELAPDPNRRRRAEARLEQAFAD